MKSARQQHATDLEYAIHEASVAQVVQAPQALSKVSACLHCLYRSSELLLLMLQFLCWLLLTACMHTYMHCQTFIYSQTQFFNHISERVKTHLFSLSYLTPSK